MGQADGLSAFPEPPKSLEGTSNLIVLGSVDHFVIGAEH